MKCFTIMSVSTWSDFNPAYGEQATCLEVCNDGDDLVNSPHKWEYLE